MNKITTDNYFREPHEILKLLGSATLRCSVARVWRSWQRPCSGEKPYRRLSAHVDEVVDTFAARRARRVDLLVHGQVTIIFVVSVCLSVYLFVCAEFFSAVFDPISIKLGHVICLGLVVSPRI